MCKCIVDFIKFLKFIADILTFAFTIRLTILSSKDPFKSHVIGNLSNYFKFYPNTTANIETMCVCNNVTYEHSCLKENILDGCLNISSDIIEFKPLLLRKLSSRSFCNDMLESFARNEGRKLEYIFDLRYKAIRNMTWALLIVILVHVGLYVPYFVILIRMICSKGKIDIDCENNNCQTILGVLVSLLIILTWIAKFVLSLILYHIIESSDIGKYDDFLECRNVKESFFEKFEDTDKLRRSFLAFAILNIISEVLDKSKDLFKLCAESEKKKENGSDQGSSISNIFK